MPPRASSSSSSSIPIMESSWSTDRPPRFLKSTPSYSVPGPGPLVLSMARGNAAVIQGLFSRTAVPLSSRSAVLTRKASFREAKLSLALWSLLTFIASYSSQLPCPAYHLGTSPVRPAASHCACLLYSGRAAASSPGTSCAIES